MIDSSNAETPDIVSESDAFSLEQVCEICGVGPQLVEQLVELGALFPDGDQPSSWSFALYSVTRLKRACRLRRDLELNLAGVALSLDLLDEIERLNREIGFLRARLRE